jgi:hypothetical protein
MARGSCIADTAQIRRCTVWRSSLAALTPPLDQEAVMRERSPWLLVALLSATTIARPARAQPAGDAPCLCACEDPDALARDEHEAREVLGASLALFLPAWIGGTAYATTLPGTSRYFASLPIFGTTLAAARTGDRANQAALLFSTGVQAMGALLAIVSAVELHRVRLRTGDLALAAQAAPGALALSARLRW